MQLHGLDFNPTFFSHPLAEDNLTLTHPDKSIREFWIEHGRRSRIVSEFLGREMGSICCNNTWIIDGYKDRPVDRLLPRERLISALDATFAQPLDPKCHRDFVESKLFSIAVESYTAGSHEFYLSYALTRNVGLCIDMGHFHPTEAVSNKLSAISPFLRDLMLHVSRPVRWDSDHIVTLEDELREVALEFVRHNLAERTHLGLDFFDASINRVAGWVLGTRALQQALLAALLEPTDRLRTFELAQDYTSRLVWLERDKTLPLGAVWDYFCLQQDVPVGTDWLKEIQLHEKEVQSLRSGTSKKEEVRA